MIKRHAGESFGLGAATGTSLNAGVHPFLNIMSLERLILPFVELVHVLETDGFVRSSFAVLGSVADPSAGYTFARIAQVLVWFAFGRPIQRSTSSYIRRNI